MSYRCVIGPLLARAMGVAPGGPFVTCDGCGVLPLPAWSRNGTAPPRWLMTKTDDKRDDRCPRCRPEKKS